VKSASTPLDRLPAVSTSGDLNVIIETPKGCRNKFKYEPGLGLFIINKVLPAGSVFPFDFGFVPATLAEDGDPLDVLVLMDEPVFTGCLVPSRIVGVIEAEETQKGKTERNDRLVAVSIASEDQAKLRKLGDLDPHLLKEIEHFFESYNRMGKKEFKCLGAFGPKRAQKLVDDAIKSFRKQSRK
jgi:inorganic pyrophosphatase